MASKSYIVVGGSSGIGLALTKLLSNDQNQVLVISRTKQHLENLPNVSHLKKDVLSDSISASDLPEVIDGLVYCPGSINLKPFRSFNIDSFQEDLNINLLGAVKCLQAAQKGLKKSDDVSSVLMFSTVAVSQGMPFHSSIATAKGAVEGLAKSLAAEWAPNVRVNCIAPSLTDTPLASRLLASDDKKAALAQRHPLKRVGHPEDIAHLAYFLLSDKSSWITGQVIGLDGGMSTIKL